jgi:hypothetical protein
VQHAVPQAAEARIHDKTLFGEIYVKVTFRSAFARLSQFPESKASRKAAVGQKDKSDDIITVQRPRLW